MENHIFNLILIMRSGFTHQIRIKASDWDDAKQKEMLLMAEMMEIDFWKEIITSMIIEINIEQTEPNYSSDYVSFLKQVRSMKRGYK